MNFAAASPCASGLSRRHVVLAGAGIAAAALGAPSARAEGEGFTRPITLVVPTAAGGGSDTVARALGPHLTAALGQPVVVENRVGAGGSIAAAAVARAPADGHTLLVGSSATHGANPSLYKSLAYDPIRDFAPVVPIGSFLFGLVGHPSVPASNIQEMVAYAKAHPGKLTYAGVSSTSIVMSETLMRGAGIDVLKVPHRSATLAMPDLVAGRISLAILDLATGGPFVRDGRLKALAITSRERSPLYPNLPTISETVVPGFAVESWIGLFAPARSPEALVERMNAAVRAALGKPDVKAMLASLAFDMRSSSVQEFRAFVPREIDKFTRLVHAAGIEAE
jgi:tripartite-type tricarboxylate transporter receptor subunit TctC